MLKLAKGLDGKRMAKTVEQTEAETVIGMAEKIKELETEDEKLRAFICNMVELDTELMAIMGKRIKKTRALFQTQEDTGK